MTTSQHPRKASQKTTPAPNDPPQKTDGPLLSLRTFVLIIAALAVAVGAGACVYWHKDWLMVAVAAFAGSLTFLNRNVK